MHNIRRSPSAPLPSLLRGRDSLRSLCQASEQECFPRSPFRWGCQDRHDHEEQVDRLLARTAHLRRGGSPYTAANIRRQARTFVKLCHILGRCPYTPDADTAHAAIVDRILSGLSEATVRAMMTSIARLWDCEPKLFHGSQLISGLCDPEQRTSAGTPTLPAAIVESMADAPMQWAGCPRWARLLWTWEAAKNGLPPSPSASDFRLGSDGIPVSVLLPGGEEVVIPCTDDVVKDLRLAAHTLLVLGSLGAEGMATPTRREYRPFLKNAGVLDAWGPNVHVEQVPQADRERILLLSATVVTRHLRDSLVSWLSYTVPMRPAEVARLTWSPSDVRRTAGGWVIRRIDNKEGGASRVEVDLLSPLGRALTRWFATWPDALRDHFLIPREVTVQSLRASDAAPISDAVMQSIALRAAVAVTGETHGVTARTWRASKGLAEYTRTGDIHATAEFLGHGPGSPHTMVYVEIGRRVDPAPLTPTRRVRPTDAEIRTGPKRRFTTSGRDFRDLCEAADEVLANLPETVRHVDQSLLDAWEEAADGEDQPRRFVVRQRRSCRPSLVEQRLNVLRDHGVITEVDHRRGVEVLQELPDEDHRPRLRPVLSEAAVLSVAERLVGGAVADHPCLISHLEARARTLDGRMEAVVLRLHGEVLEQLNREECPSACPGPQVVAMRAVGSAVAVLAAHTLLLYRHDLFRTQRHRVDVDREGVAVSDARGRLLRLHGPVARLLARRLLQMEALGADPEGLLIPSEVDEAELRALLANLGPVGGDLVSLLRVAGSGIAFHAQRRDWETVLAHLLRTRDVERILRRVRRWAPMRVAAQRRVVGLTR